MMLALRGIDWVLQFGRHGTVDGRSDMIDEIDRRTGYPPHEVLECSLFVQHMSLSVETACSAPEQETSMCNLQDSANLPVSFPPLPPSLPPSATCTAYGVKPTWILFDT